MFTLLNILLIHYRDGQIWSTRPILEAKDVYWQHEIMALVLEVLVILLMVFFLVFRFFIDFLHFKQGYRITVIYEHI